MKKTLIFILLMMLLMTNVVYSAYENEADILNELGLFLGSDKGYELYRKPNRLEGAVMLLRLLGKEDEALYFDYSHPFSDVPLWANPYIGYMYEKELTKGIGGGLFGSEIDLLDNQYMTFVLRALGYEDSEGDFYWENSMNFALIKNLITAQQKIEIQNGDFLRDHMVLISYEALKSKLNDFDVTLLTKLYNEGNVSYSEIFSVNELFPFLDSDKLSLNDMNYNPSNLSELTETLKIIMLNFESDIDISLKYYSNIDNFESDFTIAFNDAHELVKLESGFHSYAKNIAYSLLGRSLSISFGYYAIEELVERSQEIAYTLIYENIKKEMNDFKKILTIHDLIIERTRYDIENYENNTIPRESYSMCGVLIEGTAVCQGYAETFNYIMKLLGIDSRIVYGVTQGDHAWNMVKLDGEYYHIDVTYDDPISQENILSYKYFLVSDEYLKIERYWEEDEYPKANGYKYNYFNYYNLVADSVNELETIITNNISVDKDLMMRYENISDDLIRKEISNIIFNIIGISNYSISVDTDLNFVKISDVIY